MNIGTRKTWYVVSCSVVSIVAVGIVVGMVLHVMSWNREIPDQPLTDVWRSPLPVEAMQLPWTTLKESEFAVLGPEVEELAIRELLQVPFRPLDEQEAGETYKVPTPATNTGRKPYLVRGIAYCEADGHPYRTGKFVIRSHGDTVWVEFGCLGRRKAHVFRKPVVVWLASPPGKVYVTCQMAG
jgi:hypothetical protein